MTNSARKLDGPVTQPARVLGRGLHARRGVHLPLRTLREGAGKTQVEVARSAQMDQADISRLERRAELDECQLATLRRYIEALGGKLELVAVFGDKKFVCVGVEPDDEGEPGKGPRA